MGRTSDPTIKSVLLEKILDYLIENGIQGLSLRPLAKAIGTNARMLNYHFGSKENMIVEVLAYVQSYQMNLLAQRPSPNSDMCIELENLWQWFTSEEIFPITKLFLEVEAQSLNNIEDYRSFARKTFHLWEEFLESRFELLDEDTISLIVATITGLLLVKHISPDDSKVDKSYQAFVELVKAKY